MRTVAMVGFVLVALFASAGLVMADNGGRRFTTTLSGEAEVTREGVPDQGDLDGTGTATITLNHGQERVCWEISVSGITLPAAAAHIHVGPATTTGPVIVTLSAPDGSGSASGCTSATRELIKNIIQHPEAYYVNVHTSDFPAGAVRGQLGK